MSALQSTDEFEAEMDELAKSHPADIGLIDALIDELMEDDDTVSTLSHEVPKWHYLYKPPFEIKRFGACWQLKRRIYILKPYGEDGHLIGFRVFIGHDLKTDEYFVLSVQPRSSCYDTSTDAFRHLCDRYDKLDIPAIGRYS